MDTFSWGPVSPSLHIHLQALRAVGDPPLDRLLSTEGLAIGTQWQAALESPQGVAGAPLPFSLDLPQWADLRRLARACAFFGEHAVPLSLLLGSASLLECFACARGARDLAAARTLPRDPRRRVGRTGQFVLDVLTPAAWSSGVAPRALARVRILHATTRHRLRLQQHPTPSGESPLCQEDQLGTLLAFGLSPLLRLRHQGIAVPASATADMLHLWRVAGHLLGASVADLPETEDEARILGAAIQARNFAPSAEGRQLTAAVLDTYAQISRLPALHGGFLRWLRAVLGEPTCDLLGVDSPPAGRRGHLLAHGSGAVWRAWRQLTRLPGASHLHTVALTGLRRHAEAMASPPRS